MSQNPSVVQRLNEISDVCSQLAKELLDYEAASLPSLLEIRPPIETARFLLKLHRRRDDIFGKQLFSQAAWDILLHLLIDQAEPRAMSISSLCLAIGISTAVGMRWIVALEEFGLLIVTPYADDRSTRAIRLLPHASAKLSQLLAEY